MQWETRLTKAIEANVQLNNVSLTNHFAFQQVSNDFLLEVLSKGLRLASPTKWQQLFRQKVPFGALVNPTAV